MQNIQNIHKTYTRTLALSILALTNGCAVLDGLGICDNDGTPFQCNTDFPNGDPDNPQSINRELPRWPMPIDPPASNYQINEDNTVTDQITGLVWQRNPTLDAPAPPAVALSNCNNLVLGDANDWRLPTEIELLSLVNYKKTLPASDFSDIPARDAYWSATGLHNDANQTWVVPFDLGGANFFDHSKTARTLCVRGDNPNAAGITEQYTVEEFVVRDHMTVLTWQRTPANGTFTFADAVAFCEELILAGETEWRLPHIQELHSIVRRDTLDPAIDTELFPDTPSDIFWSSTALANSSDQGWGVNFIDGFDEIPKLTDQKRVRCVH